MRKSIILLSILLISGCTKSLESINDSWFVNISNDTFIFDNLTLNQTFNNSTLNDTIIPVLNETVDNSTLNQTIEENITFPEPNLTVSVPNLFIDYKTVIYVDEPCGDKKQLDLDWRFIDADGNVTTDLSRIILSKNSVSNVSLYFDNTTNSLTHTIYDMEDDPLTDGDYSFELISIIEEYNDYVFDYGNDSPVNITVTESVCTQTSDDSGGGGSSPPPEPPAPSWPADYVTYFSHTISDGLMIYCLLLAGGHRLLFLTRLLMLKPFS